MRLAAQYKIVTTAGLAQTLLLTFFNPDGSDYDLTNTMLRGGIEGQEFVCQVTGFNSATITWQPLCPGAWCYDVFTVNTVTGNELPLLRGVINVITRVTPWLTDEPPVLEGAAEITMPEDIDGRVVVVEGLCQVALDVINEAKKYRDEIEAALKNTPFSYDSWLNESNLAPKDFDLLLVQNQNAFALDDGSRVPAPLASGQYPNEREYTIMNFVASPTHSLVAVQSDLTVSRYTMFRMFLDTRFMAFFVGIHGVPVNQASTTVLIEDIARTWSIRRSCTNSANTIIFTSSAGTLESEFDDDYIILEKSEGVTHLIGSPDGIVRNDYGIVPFPSSPTNPLRTDLCIELQMTQFAGATGFVSNNLHSVNLRFPFTSSFIPSTLLPI